MDGLLPASRLAPRKSALVAAMRQLRLILDAMLRGPLPWQSDRVPMAGEA